MPLGASLEESQSNPHYVLQNGTQIKGQVSQFRLPVHIWIFKAGYDIFNWLLLLLLYYCLLLLLCKMQMRNKLCLFLPHVGINHNLTVWSVLFNTNSIDISALLGYLAVSMGSLLQAFQDGMSVKKYPMMQHISVERRAWQHHGKRQYLTTHSPAMISLHSVGSKWMKSE